MLYRRYLIQFTTRQGDKMCKVVKALTMFEACSNLGFGAKLRSITFLGSVRY